MIIKKLENLFAEHGFCETIVTDNGRQFVSHAFEQYLEQCGIKHVKSSPYFPRSNGKIERFHRYLKRAFKTAKAERKDWKNQLPKILQIYRATPHRSSGKTPALLLLNREIKTKLPTINKEKGTISTHTEEYLKDMKTYSDIKRNAKYHNLKIGDIVHAANLTNTGKLEPRYGSKHVIINSVGRDTFQIVNVSSGVKSVRNAKYLRHAALPENIDMDNITVNGHLNAPMMLPRDNVVNNDSVPVEPVEPNHNAQAQAPVEIPLLPEPAEVTENIVDKTLELPDRKTIPVTMDKPKPVLRERSQRQRRVPNYLKDYITK